MRKLVLVGLVLLLSAQARSQEKKVEGWLEFARTKFEAKYNEKAGEYFMLPVFPSELKALIGKEINLEGYYLPIDIEGNAYIILSKFPFSQCFFCGGAGPESIAEVVFKSKQTKFEADQYLRVKGKLKLNSTDLEHGNFILEEAMLLSK